MTLPDVQRLQKHNPMKRVLILLFVVLLNACSPISKSTLRKTFIEKEKSFNDHIGFALFDLKEQKTVFEYQSDKYFTPASNTKIFTLFASLKILGDSIPALYYTDSTDSLILWGSGDPSFLYKNISDSSQVYSFLSSAGKPLYLSTSNFYTTAFGSGWAWDDYNSGYSPERSPFPVYGNIVSVEATPRGLTIAPKFFKHYLKQGPTGDQAEVIRKVESNDLVYRPSWKTIRFKDDIPFKVDSLLTGELLSDTLHRPVRIIHKQIPSDKKVLYGLPSDSLYSEMMKSSDNLIAEQLLLVCSGVLSDSLKTEITIKHVKKTFLSDLPDEPIWVDGSGLSRYNLFTPRSIVQLWNKIYTLVPRERLFPLLAIGGQRGTLRNYYKSETPYVFGKTGSLSNNHCLSGFIVTKKGNTYIFSFMNSNFVKPGNEVRTTMQSILNDIYEKL
jgi:D-alanyl-D-alanine carboxypeptidase/D-alanyl-D-alanine-endopeptidase (penicillin-binding protein 4)